jgi:nitrate/nitrite transport system permease protein
MTSPKSPVETTGPVPDAPPSVVRADAPVEMPQGSPRKPWRPPGQATSRQAYLLRSTLSTAGYALLGVAVVVVFWSMVAGIRPDLPNPLDVLAELKRLLADPFAKSGPNGVGLFRLILASLSKVFGGFAMALAIGIPLGFLIGGSRTIWRMLNPIVQVLRPVSPLAWFPIWLVIFKDSLKASVFTIGVTALWPTLVNTAFGVAGVPEDHRNVGRVFRFGKATYVRHVLLPYALPSILTGMRLSMGIAWMVIVATEMLAGGTGIGFFVWDSYNNSNMAAVVSAILFIGLVGYGLDLLFGKLAQRADYEKVDDGHDQQSMAF